MSINELFLNLTSTTTPDGNEHLMEPFLPKGWKKDAHGNYFFKIGESSTMFTSHLDTADSGAAKKITHEFQGDIMKTDGKTILGADDKAGVAIMIHMIDNKIPGLYYFFLCEERGRRGSQALARTIKSNPEEYKSIKKVISFDRSGFDNLITYQASERCCSEAFGKDLCEKLNAAGGFKYKNDPTGLYTDSYSFIDLFPECTNLSVGYRDQHFVRETQDIVFLQKLADACLKVDWESLVIERDNTKTEYKYDRTNYNNRTSYNTTNYNNSRYDWEDDDWNGGGRNAGVGPTKNQSQNEYVKDYLGDTVRREDCHWCEYDKTYCLKAEAIWVDYIGFWTTPDVDPSKVKKTTAFPEEFAPLKEEDIKVGLELYVGGKLYGKIESVDGDKVRIAHNTGNSSLALTKNKVVSNDWFIKKTSGGTRALTSDKVQRDMIVFHPSFGEGKILQLRTDKAIAKIQFKDGVKNIMISVANMKF